MPLPTGGFRVRIASGPNTSRTRFTIAHEIGHTFFYDLRALPPKRFGDVDSPSAVLPFRYGNSKLEEDFCDALASELLLPEESARAELESIVRMTDPFRFLVGIERVSAKWGVSVLTTLSRLNTRYRFPTNLLATVFRRQPHVKSGKDPSLRVVYSYPKPSQGWFLPANKRAASIGFTGANILYRWWEEFPHRISSRKYRRSGIFSFKEVNGNLTILENQRGVANAIAERLQVWTRPTPEERWRQVILRAQVVYRMYAASPGEAYCLAIISTSSPDFT